MLQPGSKGWINKFFYLVDKNDIDTSFVRPKRLNEEHFMHLYLGQTGLNFGFASELLFCKDLDDNNWTSEEKLKLLLFESHYFVYLNFEKKTKICKEGFIDSMLDFYGKHNSYSIKKIFTFFIKEVTDEKLEDILSKRVDIKVKLLDNRIWINSLSNVFVYLDVILYHDYLKSKNQQTFSNYNELATNALIAIILAASSDGAIQETEKSMFKIFLASANLQEEDKEFVQNKFKKGAKFDDFTQVVFSNWMFKQFILDLSILTIYSKNQTHIKEEKYLQTLCDYLKIPTQSFNESELLIEKFVLQNNDKVSFLQSTSSYEKMYSSLSKHWLKILGRNKDKLAAELKQSKDLVFLIKKSATEDLSKEEKEIVKSQFLDIVKSMPSLAIFLLPGGAILLPLVLKIIPDLVPSAFRDNEIEKKIKK
jgi:hypothetical protein